MISSIKYNVIVEDPYLANMQQTTQINLKGISAPNIFNHIDETLNKRFNKKYIFNVSHTARAIIIKGERFQ